MALGYGSVRDMLRSVTSVELTEWRAYEYLNGPLGPGYEQNALAEIHEMLQNVCRLLVAQNVEDEDDIPDVEHYPRPHEVFKRREE